MEQLNIDANTEIKSNKGGLTSWENESLPLLENIKRNWRNLSVHCWGPAGSLVFHVLTIGVLIAATTGSTSTYIESNPVEIVANAQPEKIEPITPIEPIKEELKQQEEVMDPNVNSEGYSTVESTEPIGGAGNQDKGYGIGSGDPSLTEKGFEMDITAKSRLIMKGLFHQRTSGGIKGALGKYNIGGIGSGATEIAVLKALRWLKKEQLPDGSWKGEKVNAPPAMTSLALLAFLAHGETPSSSPEFGQTVKNAIDWLISNQEPNGHFKGKDSNDYSQPIAAYALCEASVMIPHPSIKDAAVKAINEIIKGQHPSGGFNYNLNLDNRDDSSYMAWCCQALKAAKMAELYNDVPALDSAIKKAIMGFKSNADPYGGFGYTSKGKTGLSGAGTLCLQLLGNPKASEVTQTIKFLETCTFSFATPDQQPYGGGSQVYYWYYITQAKFHHSPETFNAWNKLFSTELCKQQIVEKNAIKDMKGNLVDIGHWVSPSKGEHTGGLVQDTALCTLMLEVYYRYLPSFKPIEDAEIIANNKENKEDINVKVKIQ